MKQAAKLPEGALLIKRYAVGTALQQDEIGVAYTGYDRHTDRAVTVQEYLPDGLAARNAGEEAVMPQSAALGERFFVGCQAFYDNGRQRTGIVGTTGLTDVRDAFFANGTAYYITDFVAGVSLKAYLETTGRTLTAGQMLTVLDAVSGGLLVLHSLNRLHGGITVERIWLPQDDADTPLAPMLTGFALPDDEGDGGDASSDANAPWHDIHALGAAIYRAYTGHAVPLHAREEAFLPLGPPLDQLLQRMLADEAPMRYDSVFSLLHALGGIDLAREPVPVNAALIEKSQRNRVVPGVKTRRKRHWRVAMAITAALLAVAALCLVLYFR